MEVLCIRWEQTFSKAKPGTHKRLSLKQSMEFPQGEVGSPEVGTKRVFGVDGH